MNRKFHFHKSFTFLTEGGPVYWSVKRTLKKPQKFNIYNIQNIQSRNTNHKDSKFLLVYSNCFTLLFKCQEITKYLKMMSLLDKLL